MAKIVRPRPQWTPWFVLGPNKERIMYWEWDSISHEYLFNEGFVHVCENLYFVRLHCCQPPYKAPYQASRDSARNIIKLAFMDLKGRSRQWSHDADALPSIIQKNTDKLSSFHAGAILAIKILCVRAMEEVNKQTPNPCWECFGALLDDYEGSLHHYYMRSRVAEPIKPFELRDTGEWSLDESMIRHL